MDQILFCRNHIPSVTMIYNSFIQHEMLDANGSYVKVYLYLSMCIQSGNTTFSISSLADQMENTEKDIIRALNYWEKHHLLKLQHDEAGEQITGIEFLMPAEEDTQPFKEPVSKKTTSGEHDGTKEPAGEFMAKDGSFRDASLKDVSRKDVSPSDDSSKDAGVQTASQEPVPGSTIRQNPEEIHVTEEQTLRLSNDPGFKWISQIVESFVERPLNHSEVQFLMYLYDTMHFSKELVLYLYEYCCTLGKTNLKYVQAVAFSWADQSITTPEQAKAASKSYNTMHTAIAKAFGLNRTLGAIEIQFVNRWSSEWHFELSVILEACNRTLLAIQKADFKYADKILSNWHQHGVKSKHDIKIFDENHTKRKPKEVKQPHVSYSAPLKSNQFQAFQQRELSSADMDELEKRLLSR